MPAHTDELPVLTDASRMVAADARLPLSIAAASILVALLLSIVTPMTGASAPAPAAIAVAGAARTDFTARPSHGGVYRGEVAVSPRTIHVGEGATWVFRLTRRNARRLAGASVELQPRLVDRGDSATATIPARYVGAGRYEVRDVRLTETGWWNLALTIRGAWGTDSLAFNVVLDR